MQFELDGRETAALQSALDRRIHEMHEELVRTDDRTWRKGLRADVELLESIARKLMDRWKSEGVAPRL